MFKFKKNNKNILKHASYNKSYPLITPAKNSIPDWFKNGTRFPSFVDPKKIVELPIPLTGFKLCTVFTDAMTTGYMIPLPVDIAVKQTDGGPSITWNDSEIKVADVRPVGNLNTLPIPLGCSDTHFTWTLQYAFTIPKGYSALMSHPYNRYDLPFITLTGVVDGEIDLYGGSAPFFMSNTFEGIIPAGTPMMQIHLFKRENWSSEHDESILLKSEINRQKSKSLAYGWYKQNHWHKKSYD